MSQNLISLTLKNDQIAAIDQTIGQLEGQLQGLISLKPGGTARRCSRHLWGHFPHPCGSVRLCSRQRRTLPTSLWVGPALLPAAPNTSHIPVGRRTSGAATTEL